MKKIESVWQKLGKTPLLHHAPQPEVLFEVFHSGFKIHHSTEMLLVRVTNDLFMASDTGLVSKHTDVLLNRPTCVNAKANPLHSLHATFGKYCPHPSFPLLPSAVSIVN